MRRPLEPLVLNPWDDVDSYLYDTENVVTFKKELLPGERTLLWIDTGNQQVEFDANEVRTIHAWLGQVVADLDLGV